MATATNPDIVIVSGGWHVPENYIKLKDALTASGYQVHVPRLASVSETRPPTGDLYSDTVVVRSLVVDLVEAGRTVIAIMHSYGGQVGTNALHGLGLATRSTQGLPGGVAHLVYMCAFALPEGEFISSLSQEFGHAHHMALSFDVPEDLSSVVRDPRALFIGDYMGEATEEEVVVYLSQLTRWNGKCWGDIITNTPAWKEIPVTYLYCSKDEVLPPDYQARMIKDIRARGREVEVVTIETAHSPHLAATKEVVGAVDKVVAGIGSGN
ncbi:Alpha/beta hydrolase fold-1 [Cercophora scortea]|uniref:Alpha/beta hydrolase fold-1 n=1 Tax=Cercophora scortea TaxID=314031 RepID=A0AAE0IV62_9PEZI|nr:Alpha/beta hydrolase fold-1 [Cercophora scortea]